MDAGSDDRKKAVDGNEAQAMAEDVFAKQERLFSAESGDTLS